MTVKSIGEAEVEHIPLTSPESLTRTRAYTIAFWLLLLAFELLVLSLPLFPTGDSGLHIYYATIFKLLVTHSSSLYSHFYAVRHVVQPYLLHYYVFIALCTFLSPDTAEKVLVMVVLASEAIGFRRLIAAYSSKSPGLVLLIFPFLLNWPLAMGGLNNDFALGIAMFALAVYEKLPEEGFAWAPLLRFAGLLLLLVLSHPVPLLLLVCILGTDLLLRLWNVSDSGTLISSYRIRLLALALACAALLVPMLLADKGEVGKSLNQIRFHGDYLRQLTNASRLSMFYLPGFLGRVYNKCFFLLYPAAMILILQSGFLTRLRERRLCSFDRLAIFTVLLLIASLFAPEELNGSGFFAVRLWLPCWLFGLAAASGALRGRRQNLAVAVYGIVLGLIALGVAQRILLPIAVESATIEHAPLPIGQRGLFVQSRSGDTAGFILVNYPIFWWDGGRAFITHHDVMLNSAWLHLTIAPVKEYGQSGLLRDYTARVASEDPNSLAFYLNRHPGEQTRALQSADFIFFVDPTTIDPDVNRVLRLTLEPHRADWHCEGDRLYAICTKQGSK